MVRREDASDSAMAHLLNNAALGDTIQSLIHSIADFWDPDDEWYVSAAHWSAVVDDVALRLWRHRALSHKSPVLSSVTDPAPVLCGP